MFFREARLCLQTKEVAEVHQSWIGELGWYNIQLCKGTFTPSVSVNAAMMLAILLSFKTVESLHNGVATHFQVTPLFSMRTELLALSQSCSSVDANVWCKRALGVSITSGNIGVIICLHLKLSMELLTSKLSFFKWTSCAPTSLGDRRQNDLL